MSLRVFSTTRFSLLTLVLVLALNVPALGQRRDEPDSFLNQQRAIEELTRSLRDQHRPPSDQVEFDYGGYYSFFLFMYDDGVNSSRTFRRHDLRLWSRLSLDQGAHQLYARSRLSFIDFNPGDQFDDEDDVEGMNLERGFYKFDLSRAMRAYANKSIGYNIEFKIGRDFTQFGTGLAMSLPLDQVWVRGTFADWQVTGLAGKTVGSMQDFDLARNPSRTRRTFFGVETKYLGFERHEPFGYVFWQRDHNKDGFRTPLQRYDYDSFYVGVGSTGELVDNLRYSTEWVFETGRSYGDRRFLHKNRINAWAYDLNLEYLFDAPGKPRASVEYLLASGEPTRLQSPTDSAGGVSRGFRDASFIGFGYRDTGLSFAPRMSNIHMWRTGASYFPFEGNATFDKLEMGTNWFLYYKQRAAAAVSDPTAGVASGYLGWEMDYFANWDVTSDLSATTRYGVFFPGKAFDDRTTRTYLLFGLTWNF